MYFGKKCDQNTKVNNIFLESDELNRSVPSLASSLVIDSDDSPISVADLVKGPSRHFLTSTPNRLVSSIHFQCIS